MVCRMRTIRQGSTGAAVLDAQRHLNRHGFGPLSTDGQMGPRTAAAARDFQASAGLVADGVIGPVTWRALLATMARPSPAHLAESVLELATVARRVPLELQARALSIAVACLGLEENPRGSNGGPQIDPFVAGWYSAETLAELGVGPAWCALFLSWCVAAAAAGLEPGQVRELTREEYLSSPLGERVARAWRFAELAELGRGVWVVPPGRPVAGGSGLSAGIYPGGSIVIMDRAGSSSDAAPSSRGGFRAGHCAMVISDDGGERVDCIAGNVDQQVSRQALRRELVAGALVDWGSAL